jgi:hypothetical protein
MQKLEVGPLATNERTRVCVMGMASSLLVGNHVGMQRSIHCLVMW